MTHFEELQVHVPDLASRVIFDIGCGKGKFAVEAALAGAHVTCLEPHAAYRALTAERARAGGVVVEIVSGTAESLPFPDDAFGFANLSEVLEHVEDTSRVLSEVHRVLVPGGMAYVSIPNRFGLYDPHYHLPFINWMPRLWAEQVVTFFGLAKDSSTTAGRQRLSDMHYLTRGSAFRLLTSQGFAVRDIRELKLARIAPSLLTPLAVLLYRVLASWYFSTGHYLAKKL